MTDIFKPNGDRDRPSDCEAAKNRRGPAMGPPEGTASPGSTSPPLDIAVLRELANEFGYWPASTHEADIECHRRDNAADKARHEAYLREYGPGGPKRHQMGPPEERGPVMSADRGWIADPPPQQEHHTPGWLYEKGTGHSHFHPYKWYRMMGAPLRERESHGR